MSRNAFRGPKLPKFLLDQVHNGNPSKRGHANISRKDRRKEERRQKKVVRSRPSIASRGSREARETGVQNGDDDLDEDEVFSSPEPAPRKPVQEAKPLKSILKRARPAPSPESERDTEEEEHHVSPRVWRAVNDRIAEDDEEIAALEKKLGIKGQKSKALKEDGLDWLVDGSGSESEDESKNLKRKWPEDTKWLRDKRLKASGADRLEGDEDDELENPFSDDDVDSNDFEGFDSEAFPDEDDDEAPQPKQPRENPYVPPITKDAAPVAKYVPPSLRKPASSGEEALKQLRRQLQGLLNRLSEANMLSILKALEEIYSNNARHHVTSLLVDLLISLVSDPSTLNDTFLILQAGFATAVYKVIGTDFGAQLLEKVVESFDRYHDNKRSENKEPLNLIGFVSSLYNFQLVGSGMIFDYIRLLLNELSEATTELLLRIIRTSGQQLRQDDPSSLKDIVLLLQRSVAKIGEDKLSIRTKFMIETINNLKNNRMKAGAAASTLAAEHTAQMKKTLGSVNSSHAVKATEPLRITLADIRDSEKKGKWWLVGASYMDPAKHSAQDLDSKAKQDDLDAGYESETPGSVNLRKLARNQGMNTDIRRAIFISVLSSSDYKEAHLRLLKLHLKSKQMLEIPRVLVHCVGAEEAYNPFYALVARQFCGEHKLKKAFEFTLWDALKEMGEHGVDDDEEEGEGMNMRKTVNLGKFYGTLIANHGLSIAVLKKLDFVYMKPKTSMFVEVLLTAVFVEARKNHAAGGDFESTIKEVCLKAAGMQGLLQGLQYFVKSTVANAELGNGKEEKKTIQTGSRIAVDALAEAARSAPLVQDDETEDED